MPALGRTPALAVRALYVADLPAVLTIQCAAYGAEYRESAAVLGRKLELAPGGSWLAEVGGAAVGYVFAHPWGGVAAPPLHVPLDALPVRAERGFIHDLAVLPGARGLGVAAMLFSRVREWSGAASHRDIRLVALVDAVPFWKRHGFSALSARLPPGYGDGACLMECPLWRA